MARGEARADGDLDVLVGFDGMPTFARFMALEALLEDTLGAHVGAVTRREWILLAGSHRRTVGVIRSRALIKVG